MEAIARADDLPASDLESLFKAHYQRVARIIVNVIRDPARAEELAVEVFLEWPRIKPDRPEAWLYRTAVHVAVDELRRMRRRNRLDQWTTFWRPVRTPEELQGDRRVAAVLARLRRRDAELLALDAEGFTQAEIARALGVNPASVGTLLSRARQAFRKEYGER